MKVYSPIPFPHWVEVNEEEAKCRSGCFIILILLLLGLYFLTK